MTDTQPLAIDYTDGKPVDTLCMACTDTTCNFQPMQLQRRAVGANDVLIDMKYCGVCHSDLHKAADHNKGIGATQVMSRVSLYFVNVFVFCIVSLCSGPRALRCLCCCGFCCDEGQGWRQSGRWLYGRFLPGVPRVQVWRRATMQEEECWYLSGRVLVPFLTIASHALILTTRPHLPQSPDLHGRAETFPKGGVTLGGYTTKMVVHEHFAIIIPPAFPLEYAGPVMCAGITMYDPLKKNIAKLGGANVSVGIIGIGGLGAMVRNTHAGPALSKHPSRHCQLHTIIII